MQSRRSRLDRFMVAHAAVTLRDVRLLLAQQRIVVNGQIATSANQIVEQFTQVVFDGKPLQNNTPLYIMLHKPMGVVSATVDAKHTTVIDLLTHPHRQQLHIVGRLDFNSTGLLLLTNNGQWSRAINCPQKPIIKKYRVQLACAVNAALAAEYCKVFTQGIYFEYEGITTAPAQLRFTSEYEADVGLTEGKYHQIKRMFGYFNNPVVALHRTCVGGLALDVGLAAGQSRLLSAAEAGQVFCG